MKFNGIVPKVEREEVIPVLSKNGNLYFIAKPIESYEAFDLICPRPVPPVGGEPGKEKPMLDAQRHLEAMAKYSDNFNDWLTVQALTEVAGDDGCRHPLEWSTVVLTDISTYANWRKELQEENGLVGPDIRRIEMGVLRCNALDDTMIERAKDHFLATQKVEALPQ